MTLVLITVAVVLALTYSPADDNALVTTPGKGAAPAFAVPDLRDPDRTIELRDFRGRPLVLNFWASWCVPCRREMPTFQAVFARVGDDVAFLGINHQDNRDAALNLLNDTGVRYPSGFDPDGDIARAYELFGMPTTVFIFPDGRVVGRRTGEMSRRQLEGALRKLFDVEARSAR